MAIVTEQKGKDVIFTIGNDTKILTGCDALKLMNTIYNKAGSPCYTVEEMEQWDLVKKEVKP